MKKPSVITLFIIWLIFCSALGLIIGIAATIYAVNNHLTEFDLPNMSKILIGIIYIVFFCPPLFLISRKAKKDQVKPIQYISLGLLVCTSFVILSNIIPLIKYILM